ncbi:hypothetical protein [Epinotia aporema granulovirus]|uniref:Uncharacterized protein n=1 Tax=Epinotia aporema granulovirus TaxID=166056 RepID=K4ERU2_9BBAC|nr:hypothetical protein [Epinotia aporema granulovirus]AER41480.1 hypothetical protein [Epinotia aporema granulovirus]
MNQLEVTNNVDLFLNFIENTDLCSDASLEEVLIEEMCNMSRQELIKFLLFVKKERMSGTIVSFYEKTGVQWYTLDDNCNKCDNVTSNERHIMDFYECERCKKSKFFYYKYDDDMYDFIMNRNNYCVKCIAPLYNIVDVEYDVNYNCFH